MTWDNTFNARIVRRVQLVFDAELAVLNRLNDRRDRVSFLLALRGTNDIETLSMPRNRNGFAEIVFRTGELLAVDALSSYSDAIFCSVMKAEGYEAYLGAPIKIGGLTVAILEVIRREPHRWRADEKTMLADFASEIRSSLELSFLQPPKGGTRLHS